MNRRVTVLGFFLGMGLGASFLWYSQSPTALKYGLQADRVHLAPANLPGYNEPPEVAQGLNLAAQGKLTAALRLLKPAALAGHPRAEMAIGMMYFRGDVLPPDQTEGVAWWKLAGNQGDARADKLVALALAEGVGAQSNLPLARRWLGRSADLGDPQAQFLLARMLLLGEGGVTDPDKGIGYLRSAASNGSEGARQVLRDLEPKLLFFRLLKAVGQSHGGKVSLQELLLVSNVVASQYGNQPSLAPADEQLRGSFDRMPSISSMPQETYATITSMAQNPSHTLSDSGVQDPRRTIEPPAMPAEAIGQITPQNPAYGGLLDSYTGQYLPSAGAGGYVDPRDGTFYTRAGPNGVVNTKTGQFIPTSR
jgi:TPR repeat protein